MNVKLDFAKFKKTKVDQKKGTTTLKHPDGHEITISHKALSSKIRDRLHALPMSVSEGSTKSKDPTRQHELPGDKIPDHVEQAAVAQIGRRMADGGQATLGSMIGYPGSPPVNKAQGGQVNNPKLQQAYMADGGGTPGAPQIEDPRDENYPKPSPSVVPQPAQAATATSANDTSAPIGKRIGAHHFGYAQGGSVSSDDDIIQKKAAIDAYNKTHEDEPQQYPQEVEARMQKTDVTPRQKLADGGAPIPIALPVDGSQDLPPVPASMQSQGDIPPPQPQAGQQPYGTPDPTQAPQPAAEAGLTPQQESTQPQAQDSTTPQADSAPQQALPDMLHGYNQTMAGIRGGAAAQGNLGNADAASLQVASKNKQDAIDHFNTSFNAIDQDRKHFQDDLNNSHIDPQRFMSSLSTGQKISSAIGLVLGGLGSGLTGGPNQALQFLNQQIDRDIDGQKADLGKKESLLSMNMQRFGSLRDATEMTRLQMKDMTDMQIQKNAAQAQSPMAKAAAQQLLGQHEQEAGMAMRNIAMSQALYKSGANGHVNPELLNAVHQMNPEVAKDFEARHVPGIGNASIPVPDKAKDSMVEKTNLLTNIQKLRDFAQKNSGSIDPAVINEGKALSNITLNQMRTATDQGVIKPSEIEFDRQLIDSDPTKFFNKMRVDPKYKVVEQWATRDLNAKRQEYDLPPLSANQNRAQNLTPQQQSFLSWAQKNPGPKATAVLKKLGME